MVFKVIIAGSRSFNDYSFFCEKCDKILINKANIEVVSGGAKGADKLAEKYAKEKGYSFKLFKADWHLYDKKAGPIRNRQMAEYANALICFWDGKSRGSKNMIELARDKNLLIREIIFNPSKYS